MRGEKRSWTERLRGGSTAVSGDLAVGSGIAAVFVFSDDPVEGGDFSIISSLYLELTKIIPPCAFRFPVFYLHDIFSPAITTLGCPSRLAHRHREQHPLPARHHCTAST